MKTKLFTTILFVLAVMFTTSAQTAKPIQTVKKTTTTQTVQNQTVPIVDVEIKYDAERQFYYIAEKESSKIIKALPYKEVNDFNEGLALVKTEKSIGFINSKGIEVVSPNGKYHWANDFSNGLAVVGTKDKYGDKISAGFINKAGVLVFPMIYQDAKNFSENLAAVKKGGKWGFINRTGTVIIPLKYVDAYTFAQGLAIAGTEITLSDGYKKTKYGYIDKTGKTIIPFKYTYATKFHKSIKSACAIVCDELNEYNLIDKTGKIIYDFKYNSKITKDSSEYIYPSSAEWSNDSKVKLDYGSGYTKEFGIYDPGIASFIVKPEYSDLIEINNGNYLVEKYGSKGICKFEEKVPVDFNFIFDQDSLYFAVYGGIQTESGINDGKFILYNYDGKKITKYEYVDSYDQMTAFFEGLARVKRNGKYGYINKKGEEVITLEYDSAGVFNSGIAVVFKGGKAGAINKKNENIIPFEYEVLGDFFDGFSYYKKNNLFGIIENNGKTVTEPIFDKMGEFSEGLAPFAKDKKVGYVNARGEIIITPSYDYANPFNENLALVKKNDKISFIDLKGNEVIPYKYDNANNFKNGYALVLEGEKYLLIDKKGNIIKSY